MMTAACIPMDARRESRADLSLMAVSIIWGSTFILTKQALTATGPMTFLSLRFALASICLAAICLVSIWRKAVLRPAGRSAYQTEPARSFRVWRLWRDGLLLGTVLFLAFVFQTFGLKYTSASVTAFICGLYVVMVPFLSAGMLKKWPRGRSLFGVAVAMPGLWFMTGGNTGAGQDFGIGHLGLGELLVLCSALCQSLHIICTDVFSRRHDPLPFTTVQILVMTLLAATAALVMECGWGGTAGTGRVVISWTPTLFYAVVITGLFATVVAFLVQTGFQKYTTPTKAALIFMLEPVSSLGFNYALGGEALTTAQWFGAGLILFSMMAAIRPGSAGEISAKASL